MTAKYHLIVHPELRDQLRALHQAAQRDPGGPEAQQFEAARNGRRSVKWSPSSHVETADHST